EAPSLSQNRASVGQRARETRLKRSRTVGGRMRAVPVWPGNLNPDSSGVDFPASAEKYEPSKDAKEPGNVSQWSINRCAEEFRVGFARGRYLCERHSALLSG